MHTLFREVRFSVNPFGAASEPGFNSYAGRPCGDGLAVFLSLGVELKGPLDCRTGFVVNVSEIDRAVRQTVLPEFQEGICRRFARAHPVGLGQLYELLQKAGPALQDQFPSAAVSRLVLALNPYRKITLVREASPVRLYSEQFEFAAMHRLWNDQFTEAQNFEKFGKCANPAGHGHNYIVEVTVQVSDSIDQPGWISGFQQVVQEQFLTIVDHKNLNHDVAHFNRINPTVENISSFAWECLCGKFEGVSLKKITVWENDRTCCTYEEI
jgi:6-pyruvoyltetrahydropterin/6-carboxytetrahydropterin synthase